MLSSFAGNAKISYCFRIVYYRHTSLSIGQRIVRDGDCNVQFELLIHWEATSELKKNATDITTADDILI